MPDQSVSIPAQQLIEAGPFRANSRAQVTVEADALDLARITVRSGEFTTTIMLAGDHLDQLAKALRRIPADAPPGQDYGAEQAGKILGVSGRRVRQLAQEGRLEVVQDRPLRVTAQSVHEMRALRRGTSRPTQATPAPEGVAEQVERLLALFTAENRRAIEATESTLREVTAQRDDYRAEAERLRALKAAA